MSKSEFLTRSDLSLIDSKWKSVYGLGGAAGLTVVFVMVAEILITFLPGGGATAESGSILSWFVLLQENPLMGLRNLGMVNVIATTLSVPMFFALYVVHRKSDPVYAALALIISLMGATMYIAGNNAFAMWVLSNKYAIATTDLQHSHLLAAGEALLAQAESHTPGTFVCFLYTEFASVSISIVMLRGRIFSRPNAYAGILGFCFLFVFEVISSFYPAWFNIGMIFVAFGGLMSVGWYFLIGRRLLQLAKI